MEGFEDFIKTMFKGFVVVFAIASFITAGIYYEKNKDLKKELFKCEIENNLLKQ